MIRVSSILLGLGFSIQTFSQTPCDHQKAADSVLLLTFSKELKRAVMTYDMSKIASFFRFPFLYSSCTLDEQNVQDTVITQKKLVAIHYVDFFGCWFSETVSKGYIFDSFDCDIQDGLHKFIFSYPACFPKKSLCKQHSFSVEKIDGHYKITSSWLSQ